tara:strand:- start:7573 stop:8199 length:627 start_codon:yes stop_codon:yes gene_type:complete
MARIGSYEISNMKRQILRDLYGKEEDKLTKRRIDIAKKSRELYLAPMQHLLDKLPEEMVARDEEYCLRIKYTPGEDKTQVAVDEKWKYKTDQPITNPKSYGKGNAYYSNGPENELDPRLQDSAMELCNDILALRTEKEKMSQYLNETTTKYTGSLQLRKIWDSSLHKYLPTEPVKTPRSISAKKTVTPDPTTPIFLKNRMTTNLLEDN